MKTKALAIIFAAASALTATAQKADSTVTITNADRIVITESPNGLCTTVTTSSGTQTYRQDYRYDATVMSHFSTSGLSLGRRNADKRKAVSWEMISGGLSLGFCSAPGASSSAGVEMAKSFEISWLEILGVRATNRHGNSFSLGIGIDWRNYRTTLGNRFNVVDGQVGVTPYPEGVEPRMSRIKVFSVQFPLLYRQQLPFGFTKERFALKFGPIFNLNTHASVLASWRDGQTSSKYDINGINIRPFTIDLFASLHLWEWGGIYARYSPYKALTGNNSLNFDQFSTGLILFM